MAKIVKNNLGNFLVVCFIFLMIMGWIFSGWPQIWQNPPIPPKIQEAQAATKTFLLTNGSAFTGSWQMAESNSTPSTDVVTSLKTGTSAAGNYFIFQPGVTDNTTKSTTLPTDCTKTGWRSDSTLNGTFTAGNWTFNVKLVNRAKYAHAGIVYLRIWKGNSDMTTATAITGWSASPNTISFSATAGEIKTDSFTVSVSETTLSGEYLFVEYAWKVTTAGGNVNAGVKFTSDEATGETIVTTDFTAVSITLTVDSPTKSLGNVTPGTPVTATTITTVTTNNANGYSLKISDSVAGSDSALLHTDTTTRIADYAGTIASPTSWSGTGLGICVYAADTNKEAKWGTGTTETDSNNKYAGIPQTATEIHNVGSAVTNNNTSIGYKLNVASNQKTGVYSGVVTYTAVAN